MYSACFVVVQGDLGPMEVKEHTDWAHRRIPRGACFTCLTTLTPLPHSVAGLHVWPWVGEERVCPYSQSDFVAIDGKLLHRTEPFLYTWDPTDANTCISYQESGHLRVLVSLSFGSRRARLAPYILKVLRGMVPRAAAVRSSPSTYVDSDSESLTSASSESDSAQEDVNTSLRSMRAVLYPGTWEGSEHALHSWIDASPLCLDLEFDADGEIESTAHVTGTTSADSHGCHATIRVERGQSYLLLTGDFVQASASVCLQGRYRDSKASPGVFCIFHPKPWHIPVNVWRRLPVSSRAIGLPREPQVVTIRWTDPETGAHITAPGREATWNGAVYGCACARGRTVLCRDLTQLESVSCDTDDVMLVPDMLLKRDVFERLLKVLSNRGCAALIVVQAGRPRLPRPARARNTPPDFPGFTFSSAMLKVRVPTLAGWEVSIQRESD